MRRLLERLEAEGGSQPVAILERAAVRLAAAFPAIATVRRSGFLGRGPVEEIALDVPRLGNVLRYALIRTAQGNVEVDRDELPARRQEQDGVRGHRGVDATA